MATYNRPRYTEEELSILRTALKDAEGNQSQAVEAAAHILNRPIPGLKFKLYEIIKKEGIKVKSQKWTEKEDQIVYKTILKNWGTGKETLSRCYYLISQELPNRTQSAIAFRWSVIKHQRKYAVSRIITKAGYISNPNINRVNPEKPSMFTAVKTFFTKLLKK